MLTPKGPAQMNAVDELGLKRNRRRIALHAKGDHHQLRGLEPHLPPVAERPSVEACCCSNCIRSGENFFHHSAVVDADADATIQDCGCRRMHQLRKNPKIRADNLTARTASRAIRIPLALSAKRRFLAATQIQTERGRKIFQPRPDFALLRWRQPAATKP